MRPDLAPSPVDVDALDLEALTGCRLAGERKDALRAVCETGWSDMAFPSLDVAREPVHKDRWSKLTGNAASTALTMRELRAHIEDAMGPGQWWGMDDVLAALDKVAGLRRPDGTGGQFQKARDDFIRALSDWWLDTTGRAATANSGRSPFVRFVGAILGDSAPGARQIERVLG